MEKYNLSEEESEFYRKHKESINVAEENLGPIESNEHRCIQLLFDNNKCKDKYGMEYTSKVINMKRVWMLTAPSYKHTFRIFHCPFCGIKLE